jgi:hypothetical protein
VVGGAPPIGLSEPPSEHAAVMSKQLKEIQERPTLNDFSMSRRLDDEW